MSETFDLRIDSIAAGGDGVGRHEGIVVFVPRTAPGDLVRVHAERQHRLMRGRLLELIEPSPKRTAAACAHYTGDRCGGCQVQHLNYDAQLEAKSVIISDSLTRIGKVDTAPPSVAPSDKQWRYRTKLTLALRRDGGRWRAGLHRFDAPNEIFALKDCPITDDRVLAAWSLVLEHERLFPPAKDLRAAVRLLPADAKTFSFALEGGREWPSHGELFGAVRELGELWWTPEGKTRRRLRSRVADEHAGAAFAQVNPGVAGTLRDWVLTLTAALNPRTVIDAYAGTGEMAALLAERGARVVAIELDRDAARVAAARLPRGSRAIAAAVEDVLHRSLPADLVILNPPRAGVDERVARALSAARAAVIYVSCNPATLARDIGRMSGYVIRSLRGFDMFPQTAHVETVCELVPAA